MIGPTYQRVPNTSQQETSHTLCLGEKAQFGQTVDKEENSPLAGTLLAGLKFDNV